LNEKTPQEAILDANKKIEEQRNILIDSRLEKDIHLYTLPHDDPFGLRDLAHFEKMLNERAEREKQLAEDPDGSKAAEAKKQEEAKEAAAAAAAAATAAKPTNSFGFGFGGASSWGTPAAAVQPKPAPIPSQGSKQTQELLQKQIDQEQALQNTRSEYNFANNTTQIKTINNAVSIIKPVPNPPSVKPSTPAIMALGNIGKPTPSKKSQIVPVATPPKKLTSTATITPTKQQDDASDIVILLTPKLIKTPYSTQKRTPTVSTADLYAHHVASPKPSSYQPDYSTSTYLNSTSHEVFNR